MLMEIRLLVQMVSPLNLHGSSGEFKSDFLSLFNYLFGSVEFDHRFSSSFITLIPKVESPANINDFKPISLLGVGA